MKNLPIIAIIGPTNAGKSSLLNRLLRRREAIVAREEGTTRDNVIAHTDHFTLIDTAGLLDPRDDFEASIQSQISEAITAADLILLLLDSILHPDHKTLSLVRQTQRSKKPYLIVLNKSDKSESLPDSVFRHFGEKQLLRISATTGQGIPELKKALNGAVEAKAADVFSDRLTPSPTATYIPDGTDSGNPERSPRFLSRHAQRMIIQGGERKELALFRGDAGLSSEAQTSPAEMGLSENISADFAGPIKLALIGRPNVGKSSLFNALAKKQQALVSSKQGTTRDINRVKIRFKEQELEILDTAGLRKPGKREVGIEKFSAIRTLQAIEESDICALLIDSTEPHSKLDQTLAGQILEAGKGIILVVTKTDLTKETDQILNNLETDFNFTPFAPVLLTSATQGKNITKLFDLSLEIQKSRKTELKTSDLNRILQEAVQNHPPAGLKNTKPKLRYITQTDTTPPWFVIYGSNLQQLHWSYKRYLERKIRDQHPFTGTPIKFSFKNSEKTPTKS